MSKDSHLREHFRSNNESMLTSILLLHLDLSLLLFYEITQEDCQQDQTVLLISRFDGVRQFLL